MNITAVLLTLCCLQLSARVYSQRITISVHQVPLEQVLTQIRIQSGYELVYKSDALDGLKPVTVQIRQATVEDALQSILSQQPLDFRIEDKTIVIKPQTRIEKPLHLSLIQQGVQGQVMNASGASLVGATVRIKGTDHVTMTDGSGRFFLPFIGDGKTLVVSFVGYLDKEVPIGDDTHSIILQPTADELETIQIVSTGYQQLPKERATGSFSTISSEQLNRRPTMDIMSRLEGFASGLVFNQSSLEEEPSITIRGRSTIYGEDKPLIVVDGFPVELDLYSLNPNDVQDITILKDAAAASIWGVRAANGVIVITTKKGQFNQKPVIEIRNHILLGQEPDLFYLPFMSTADYVDLEQTWFEEGRYDTYLDNPLRDRRPVSQVIQTLLDAQQGSITQAEADAYIESLKGIDVRREYADLFYRNKVQQQHVMTLRGGGNGVRYLFSAGYDKHISNELGNQSDRMTIRTDNTFRILPKLDFNVALNVSWSNKEQNAIGLYGFQGETGSDLSSVSSDQYVFLPYQTLRDEQGNAEIAPRGQINSQYNAQLNELGFLDWSYRPANEVKYRDNTLRGQTTRLATGLEYRLSDALKLGVRYQYESGMERQQDRQGLELYNTRKLINVFTQIRADNTGVIHHVPVGDILLKRDHVLKTHSFRGQVDYNDAWNQERHRIAAVAGMEMQEMVNDDRSNTYYGYNDRTLQFVDLDQSASYPHFLNGFPMPLYFESAVSDELRYLQSRFASFYGNASYTFLNRYIASLSGRMDKSSLFGVSPKDRNVPLWSLGAAWNIHQEPFMQNATFLSNLKLRATYGFNGNVNPAQSAYPIAGASTDPMTGKPTIGISSPANPLLQWEKVKQINAAVDFGFWNNRLTGSIEWFAKRGEDLFGDHFLDPSSGFTTILANVASMKGKGFDIELNWKSGQRIQWDSRLFFSHASDKVTEIALSNNNDPFSGGSRRFMQADRALAPLVNRAVYAVYSYRWAGLDAEGNPQLYDQNGDIVGKGSYNSLLTSLPPDQLVYNGPARPTYFGGWSNGIRWRGLSLSGTITYKLGHYFRRPSVNYYGLNSGGVFRSMGHKDYANRWQQPGDEAITNVPAYVPYTFFDPDRDEAYRYADILVESASHIRLKDITLSYDLPETVLQGKFIQAAQLYLYIDNVGILWRANDFDIDPDYVPWAYGSYLPRPLTMTFGFKINL